MWINKFIGILIAINQKPPKDITEGILSRRPNTLKVLRWKQGMNYMFYYNFFYVLEEKHSCNL